MNESAVDPVDKLIFAWRDYLSHLNQCATCKRSIAESGPDQVDGLCVVGTELSPAGPDLRAALATAAPNVVIVKQDNGGANRVQGVLGPVTPEIANFALINLAEGCIYSWSVVPLTPWPAQ